MTGIVAVNVEPRPGSLTTPTSPPSSVARRRESGRPRPVPRRAARVAELDELLEDAHLVLGREPRAGVADREADRRAVGEQRGRDADLAALGELQRVDHEVAQDLAELEAVGAQQWHVGRILEDDDDLGRARQAPDDPAQGAEQLLGADVRQPHGLAAGGDPREVEVVVEELERL